MKIEEGTSIMETSDQVDDRPHVWIMAIGAPDVKVFECTTCPARLVLLGRDFGVRNGTIFELLLTAPKGSALPASAPATWYGRLWWALRGGRFN